MGIRGTPLPFFSFSSLGLARSKEGGFPPPLPSSGCLGGWLLGIEMLTPFPPLPGKVEPFSLFLLLFFPGLTRRQRSGRADVLASLSSLFLRCAGRGCRQGNRTRFLFFSPLACREEMSSWAGRFVLLPFPFSSSPIERAVDIGQVRWLFSLSFLFY